jgi:hypothetical protein
MTHARTVSPRPPPGQPPLFRPVSSRGRNSSPASVAPLPTGRSRHPLSRLQRSGSHIGTAPRRAGRPRAPLHLGVAKPGEWDRVRRQTCTPPAAGIVGSLLCAIANLFDLGDFQQVANLLRQLLDLLG